MPLLQRLICVSVCGVSSQHSNLLNQARLSTLKMRDDCVHEIVEEARGRLEELAKDKRKYSTMLKALIVQVRGESEE